MNFFVLYIGIASTMYPSVLPSADLDTGIRDYTADDSRAQQIFSELQGICLNNNDDLSASKMKAATHELIKNMEIYKNVVKMNKQLKDDIKWIIQETNNEKEITQIFDMVKSDAKDTCTLPENCASLKRSGKPSGVYNINPAQKLHSKLQVWCDMNTDGGGWIVIQKRIDGSENFGRTWEDYENGFGNRSREYWLGNKWIHQLTSSHRYELRIDVVEVNGKHKYANYKTFRLKSAADKYTLVIGGYSGDAGDDMQYHNGGVFSTYERDSDTNSGNCAENYGAWWHKNCCNSGLNRNFSKRLYWHKASGHNVLTSEMKIRQYY